MLYDMYIEDLQKLLDRVDSLFVGFAGSGTQLTFGEWLKTQLSAHECEVYNWWMSRPVENPFAA